MRLIRNNMIIGVCGKGGSGKSTVSTLLVLAAAKAGKRVTAIDADHNMDLAFNIASATTTLPYFGSSLPQLLQHVGLSENADYRDAFTLQPEPNFNLAEPDTYTAAHSHTQGSIRLMTAGPLTDEVTYDIACSHTLTTPLKVYLPFVSIEGEDFVVVDERAGLDGASTGVENGFTLGVVVAEPTPHSIKAAQTIAEKLTEAGVPHLFVANKIRTPEDEQKITAALGKIAATLPTTLDPLSVSPEAMRLYESVHAYGSGILAKGDIRGERVRKRAKRNSEYQAQSSH